MKYEDVKQLSTRELLSLTLREKPESETLSVLSDQFSNPRDLVNCSVEELTENGLSARKAVQLKANIELGRRIYSAAPVELTLVKGPDELADLLITNMRYLDREHFRVILLNRKLRILSIETVSIGSLSSSIVHPRECFQPAIRKSAASIILAHNHPSGDPSPSTEDIDITRRLLEAGKILGIDVLDHLIIGDDKWISLKSLGHI